MTVKLIFQSNISDITCFYEIHKRFIKDTFMAGKNRFLYIQTVKLDSTGTHCTLHTLKKEGNCTFEINSGL